MNYDTNVGLGMVPCRPKCRCADCQIVRLRALLRDWQEFGKDVSAADCGGQDWLDELRGRTKAALEQKL